MTEYTDEEIDFLATVATMVNADAAGITNQFDQVDRNLDRIINVARRSKLWRLGPIVIAWKPIGQEFGHLIERGCLILEAPSHELSIASRRWWDAEAGA